MFHICAFIFSALLFFILTPGILLTIPPKSSKKTVAIVHALVFALVITIICYFTNKFNYNTNESFISQENFGAPLTPAQIAKRDREVQLARSNIGMRQLEMMEKERVMAAKAPVAIAAKAPVAMAAKAPVKK